MKDITAAKISELSGVSPIVVSMILRNKRNTSVRFSEKTRKKVLEFAAEHGFRPHRAARSLRGKSHNSIGILLRDQGMIPHMGIRWMLERASAKGLLITLEYFPDKHKDLPVLIREKCVDGLIMFEDFGDGIRREIEHYRIPSIWVNTDYVEGKNCIVFDDRDAMSQAVAALSRIGVGRITVIRRKSPSFFTRERDEGVMEAAERYGIKELSIVDSISGGQASLVQRRKNSRIIKGLLLRREAPTGFILDNSLDASVLVDVATSERLKIPGDLHVVSIADHTVRSHYPFISALLVETRLLSNLIVDNLCRLIGNERMDGPLKVKYAMEGPLSFKVSSRADA